MNRMLVPLVVATFLLALLTFLSRASEASAVLAERQKWVPVATEAAFEATKATYYQSQLPTPTPTRYQRSPIYP